jgi:outer membrane protein insertion porin family
VEHLLAQNVLQDIQAPVFSTSDTAAVPDPYEGYYVFSQATTIGDTTYNAGDIFPGIPTEQDIEDYDLVTDYVYSNRVIDEDYLMEYHSVSFSLGLNTGYQWFTPVGRLGVSTGARTSLEYLTYDETLYRPFYATTRNNLNQWQFTNKLWVNLSWDTRDYILNPSTGFHLNQNYQYVGGVLFGVSHLMRSSSKAEVFFTLWDLPVFENWNWKMVLALHTDFAILIPQYRRDPITGEWGWGRELRDEDFLYIDSMQIARGWGWRSGGTSRWNNWVELRMPIFEQFLWWDFFFSGTAMWEDNAEITSMNLDDFLFTFGGGLRLTIPGFPMGFYLAKRFRTNNGVVEWQPGNIGGTPAGGGIDFVISFTYEIF